MVRYSLLETLYMYMYMYMYMYRAVGIPSRDGDPDRVVASATRIGAEPSDPFYRRNVFTHPEDGRRREVGHEVGGRGTRRPVA